MEEEKICRLCLKDCGNNFTVVEENATEFMGFLLESNLSINKGALICAKCRKSIKDCSNFKSTCLDVEDFILQYHKDSNAKLDLKNANDILENHDICRLCRGSLRIDSNIALDSKAGDIMLEKIMLEKCLPELDLCVTEKPVICVPCRKSLQHYFSFITNCLDVEEKIKKYCEAAVIDDTGLIQLNDLRELTTEPVFVEVVGIKVEEKFCGDEKHMYEEKYSEELWCTSGNVLIKKDIQELNFKVEETFNEEIDCKIEVKSENLREIEEQQFENVDDQEHLNRFEGGFVSSQPVVTTRLHGKQAEHKGSLKSHLLLPKGPSEVTMYKCDSCLYQTQYKKNLKRHCLKHKDPSEVTKYECDSCLYQTKHEDYFRKHLLRHKDPSEVTMYKCESCSFETKFRKNLKPHSLKHKDPSELTLYKCDSCLYQTKYKAYFRKHLLRHKYPLEGTMYKCDFCLYQTRYKHNLKKHVVIHKDTSNVTSVHIGRNLKVI